VEGTSSFVQLEPPRRRGWRATAASFAGALEGAAAAIPSIGCATIVFSRVGPDLIASGVFATLLGLAFIHLTNAASSRPIFFNGRVLEATTLAAMLDQTVLHLPSWGLPDTSGVRLAMVCATSAGAGVWVALLYLVRAERLTPFIPSPVFAGFSNSIALALLISQTRQLKDLSPDLGAAGVAVSIALVALGVAFALRVWAPRRPAAAAGLAAGLLAGLAWMVLGHAPAVVSSVGGFSLPMRQADFHALLAPHVHHGPLVLALAGNAAILGTIIFINTALSSQAMTHVDRRRSKRVSDGLANGATAAVAGLAGSAPLSGSILVCLAVARAAAVRWTSMVAMGLIIGAVALTGVLGWVPLAAVVGVLLCEAWFLVDRPSLQLLLDWLRGRKLVENEREDLALIVAVTALAVIANMVVAAFAGLVLGLLLLAVRSARQPVRRMWTGRQLSSNCAHAPAALRLLAEHGGEIRIFELEGDLFFAVAPNLEHGLETGMEGATCAVLDWSRVRHIDTSVANTVARFHRNAAERGQSVVHAGASAQQGNVAEELQRRIPGAQLTSDLDFALEIAESRVIQSHTMTADAGAVLETAQLFDGLAPEDASALQERMGRKRFRAGEVILASGDASNELLLLLQGSASVIVRHNGGPPVRLAGVRRGAVIGELGFLDGSPRSASVVAQEDVVVATLTRDDFRNLCRTRVDLAPKLVANIATALAARLRHSNELALARLRAH
jgi:MFS superfamily sulfate permease-like transporter